MADIVICYGHEDRDFVSALRDRLSALGLSVWWDAMLPAGSHYRHEIRQQIIKCKRVIVVWSPQSIESVFLHDEAQSALDLGKLVPIFLERVTPPLGFGSVHGIFAEKTDLTSSAPPSWITELLRSVTDTARNGPHDPILQGHLPSEVQKACRERAEALRAATKRLEAIAGDKLYEKWADDIDEIFARLLSPELDIGFVGDFSVGKSTLMNAIVATRDRKPLLAVGADPTTFVPTALRWGTTVVSFIEFDDGTREPCDIKEIETFKIGNLEVERRLAHARRVVVEGVLPEAFKGVTLTDTRGAKDNSKGTRLAAQLARRFDAVVAVCMADTSTGFHDHEIDFVMGVTPKEAMRFWVVNDFGANWSSRRSRAFLWNRIVRDVEGGTAFVDQPMREGRVYVLNAKDAADARIQGDRAAVQRSGILELEEDIARHVVRAGWQVKAAPWTARLKRIFGEIAEAIEAEARGHTIAYQQRSQDCENIVAALNTHLSDLQRVRNKISERKQRALSVLEKRFSGTVVQAMQGVVSRLADTRLDSTDTLLKRIRNLASSHAVGAEISSIVLSELRIRLNSWATDFGDPDSAVSHARPFLEAMLRETAESCARISADLDRVGISQSGEAEAADAAAQLAYWRTKLERAFSATADEAGGSIDLRSEVAVAAAATPIALFLGVQLSTAFGSALLTAAGSSGVVSSLGLGAFVAKIGALALSGPLGIATGLLLTGVVLKDATGNQEETAKTQARESFLQASRNIADRLWPRIENELDRALSKLGERLNRELVLLEDRARERIATLVAEEAVSRQEHERLYESRLADRRNVDALREQIFSS